MQVWILLEVEFSSQLVLISQTFIISLLLSWYDLNNNEKDVKHQIVTIINYSQGNIFIKEGGRVYCFGVVCLSVHPSVWLLGLPCQKNIWKKCFELEPLNLVCWFGMMSRLSDCKLQIAKKKKKKKNAEVVAFYMDKYIVGGIMFSSFGTAFGFVKWLDSFLR